MVMTISSGNIRLHVDQHPCSSPPMLSECLPPPLSILHTLSFYRQHQTPCFSRLGSQDGIHGMTVFSSCRVHFVFTTVLVAFAMSSMKAFVGGCIIPDTIKGPRPFSTDFTIGLMYAAENKMTGIVEPVTILKHLLTPAKWHTKSHKLTHTNRSICQIGLMCSFQSALKSILPGSDFV